MKKSTREVRLSVNNSTIQFKTVYTICGYLITFEQREKCEQQRHLRLLFTRLSCRKNMAGASSLTFNQANRQLTFLDVFHTLPLSIFFFFIVIRSCCFENLFEPPLPMAPYFQREKSLEFLPNGIF